MGANNIIFFRVVTDNFDEQNEEHVKWKEGIEIGNSLPTLTTAKEVLKALRQAGFEGYQTDYLHAELSSERHLLTISVGGIRPSSSSPQS